MTMEAIVERHAEQHRSLVERLLRILLGLWSWDRTLDDPVMARAATAATIAYVDEALEARRAQERGFVQAYARELGVEYTADDLLTEPIYPRNADYVDVYERLIEEYRWQLYGRPNAERSERVSGQDGGGGASGDPGGEPVVAERPVSRRVPARGGPSVTVDDLAAIFEDGAPAREFDIGQWEELEALERLSDEATWDAADRAFVRALDRIEKIVDDDLSLAGADEHRQLLEKKSLWLGYRRVIHPELSESGTCGLCLAASTRLYSKRDLLPLHTDCKCTVMGVSVGADPGKDLNDADIDALIEAGVDLPITRDELESAYELASQQDVTGKGRAAPNTRGTSASQLKALRYEVVEHGELGPRLSEGRARQDKPFVEQTLADSRAMWARTAEWAEAQRDEAVAARNAADAETRERYGVIVAHYDALISRMGGKLSKQYR